MLILTNQALFDNNQICFIVICHNNYNHCYNLLILTINWHLVLLWRAIGILHTPIFNPLCFLILAGSQEPGIKMGLVHSSYNVISPCENYRYIDWLFYFFQSRYVKLSIWCAICDLDYLTFTLKFILRANNPWLMID